MRGARLTFSAADAGGFPWKSAAACGLSVILLTTGCQSRDQRRADSARPSETSSARRDSKHGSPEKPIRQVVCLFDQKPWLNLDTAGDRDPEGIRYKVFLDAGAARGVLRAGTLHVELYRITRNADGSVQRELVSDWHYHTSELGAVSAKMLGEGYHLRLRWARKDLAGSEVEVTTLFEDPEGRKARSGTKRLRVPKYSS